jgi:hypothetical protein
MKIKIRNTTARQLTLQTPATVENFKPGPHWVEEERWEELMSSPSAEKAAKRWMEAGYLEIKGDRKPDTESKAPPAAPKKGARRRSNAQVDGL